MSSRKSVVQITRVLRPMLSHPNSCELTGVSWKCLEGPLCLLPLLSLVALAGAILGEDDLRPLAVSTTLVFAGMSSLMLVSVLGYRRIAWTGLRVRSRGELHLVGGEYGGPLTVLVGLCFVGSVIAELWLRAGMGMPPSSGYSGRKGGPLFFVLVGLGCVAFGIVKPFLPSGIRICEDAVWVRKGIIEHRMPWDQLEDVALKMRGKALALELRFESGPDYSVRPMYFGSNPYYAAELILYYLRHPDRRELLRDPDAAIREVMEVVDPEELRGAV